MTLSNPAQYISGRTVQEQMNSLIDYVDQRAAEVATDAIASDVAQVHSDAADAHTDALAAAASASAAAGTLANAVKKTGEASQSIAGDIAVAGALSGGSVSSSGNVDGASIGSGATPVVCGDLTANGNVSLDDTTLQGNLASADPSALINLSGAGSVLVPTPTSNNEAANKKYVDDALDNYATMVRTVNAQTIGGNKTFNEHILAVTSVQNVPAVIPRATGTGWVKIYEAADTNHANAIMAMLPRRASSNPGFGIIAVGGHNNGTIICKWMSKDLVNANYLDKVMVTVETNVITVWGMNISATDNVNMRIIADVFNGSYMLTYNGFKAATDTDIYTMTTDGGGNIVGYTDSDNIVHTFIAYEISS